MRWEPKLRPEIDAWFLLIHFECGRLQWKLVIFSHPLCSLSISDCLNTEEAILPQRAACFHLGPHLELFFSSRCMEISPLLIPTIYSDVTHASLFFFLDCELTWAGTSKGWRLLLFNDYPFNSSALASRSWWLCRLREHQKWKRKKRIYEFTSTRPCRFVSADETLEHIRHGWRSVGNKGDEMAALICIFR